MLMRPGRRYLRSALFMLVCVTTASCGNEKTHDPDNGRWLHGPGCLEIGKNWRDGVGVLDGHVPILDLRVQNGKIEIDASSRVGGADRQGTLQVAKTLNPKPILRLRIADRTSCSEVSAALKEVTETYGCTKMHCAVSP